MESRSKNWDEKMKRKLLSECSTTTWHANICFIFLNICFHIWKYFFIFANVCVLYKAEWRLGTKLGGKDEKKTLIWVLNHNSTCKCLFLFSIFVFIGTNIFFLCFVIIISNICFICKTEWRPGSNLEGKDEKKTLIWKLDHNSTCKYLFLFFNIYFHSSKYLYHLFNILS